LVMPAASNLPVVMYEKRAHGRAPFFYALGAEDE